MPQTRSAPTPSDTLSETALSLLASEDSPWASLYMPVDRTRNRIQFRNLLGQLRDEAPLANVEDVAVEALLAPGEELLEEASLSEGRVKGVALFLTPDEEQRVLLKLPFAPSLVARLDDRVHVRPVWRGLEPDGHFYILSLWGGGIKLHRASRYDMEVVSPDETPDDSLDDILRSDDHIRRALDLPQPSATSTDAPDSQPVLYQSQKDIRHNGTLREGLLRFFRRVNDWLRPMLGQEGPPSPLLLAGPKALRRLYREANTYRHLIPNGVGNAVRIRGPEALHRQAWEQVRPHFNQEREEALEQFRSDPARTAGNPGSVLLAALEGRVDTLFVAEEPAVWGTYNEATHTVRTHPQRQAGDVEFLNAATTATLQSGGTAHVMDASALPENTSVAALLRY